MVVRSTDKRIMQMKHLKSRNNALMAAAVLAVLVATGAAAAQDPQSNPQTPDDHQQHGEHAPNEQSLVEQVAELRASVARLGAALERNHQANPVSTQDSTSGGMGMMGGHGMSGMSSMGQMGGMGSMGGMSSMGGMKGMKMKMGSMASDSGMSMGGMSQGSMKRMGMMGRMGGMSDMGATEPAATLARLPGFPGASHIYHIGSAGFFLDHAQHVQLNREQRAQLARIQEQSTLHQASTDRQIAEAEQELWVLTSAGEPDASAIDAKVREIATLSADQRIAFIRSVGEAAEVLTDSQRSVMVGEFAASPETSSEGSESDTGDHQH